MSNGTIAEELNKFLEGIYNKSDEVYTALISDEFSTPNLTPVNPVDYGIGIFASPLQWNRSLTTSLVRQLQLDQMTTEYLDRIVPSYFGISRYEGETDAEWIARVQEFIIAPKRSVGAVIAAMIKFSPDALPVILTGQRDTAFADYSYADVAETFRVETPGDKFENTWVFAAITLNSTSSAFYFLLVLAGTPVADIPKVLDYMDRWVADGVDYDIQII